MWLFVCLSTVRCGVGTGDLSGRARQKHLSVRAKSAVRKGHACFAFVLVRSDPWNEMEVGNDSSARLSRVNKQANANVMAVDREVIRQRDGE